jgi:hypothetical protein
MKSAGGSFSVFTSIPRIVLLNTLPYQLTCQHHGLVPILTNHGLFNSPFGVFNKNMALAAIARLLRDIHPNRARFATYFASESVDTQFKT